MHIPNLLSHYTYPKYTDIGNIFIVSEFDFSTIEILKKECRGLSYSFLTTQEIDSSFDIFPIHFFHIIHFGTLVSGEDIFSGKQINTSYLRTAVEYELRNKMIQLRGESVCYPPQKIIENIIPTLYPLFAPIAFLFSGRYIASPLAALEAIDMHISHLPPVLVALVKKEYTTKNQFDMLMAVQKWLDTVADSLEHVVL